MNFLDFEQNVMFFLFSPPQVLQPSQQLIQYGS